MAKDTPRFPLNVFETLLTVFLIWIGTTLQGLKEDRAAEKEWRMAIETKVDRNENGIEQLWTFHRRHPGKPEDAHYKIPNAIIKPETTMKPKKQS